MRFSQLGAAAALTAVSQAFLLPPTINAADSEIVKTLPFDVAADIDGRVVTIDCPGCPVLVEDLQGHKEYTTAPIESLLRFNFSLSHGETDHLMVNGRQIYPLDITSPDFTEALTADQLVKTREGTWNYASTPLLGFGLTASSPVASSSNSDPMRLTEVRLEVVEVAGRFMSGFPIIEIKLLETPSGKLMIGDATIIENVTTPGQECTSILCKWRAIIAEKVGQLKKGCGGKRPANGVAATSPTIPMVKPFHHGGGGHHGAHRPHRHHHMRHGRFAKFLRSLVFHVFIPIIIGVCVGITASIVGMIVGHLAIFIWRILFRRGDSSRRVICRFSEETISVSKSDDDESKGLMEENEISPPVYEDAPAYEEAVAEKV